MAKGGRPSNFKREFSGLAHKFCLLGATNADLADLFEVTERTIERWTADIPVFCRALKRGRVVANATVAERLYSRATGHTHPAVKIFLVDEEVTTFVDGEKVITRTKKPLVVPYTEHYPPETVAGIFWLKNRDRVNWRDKVEIDATHRHDPSSLTDEQLAEIAAGRRGSGASSAKEDPGRLH